MDHLAGEALAMHAREHVRLTLDDAAHERDVLDRAALFSVDGELEGAVLGRQLCVRVSSELGSGGASQESLFARYSRALRGSVKAAVRLRPAPPAGTIRHAMTLSAIVQLGYYFFKRLVVRAFKRRDGLAQFRINYAGDRLLPVRTDQRAVVPKLGGCIACGMCDAVFGEYDRAARTVFHGPSDLPLSYSRSLPDYDALDSYLVQIKKGGPPRARGGVPRAHPVPRARRVRGAARRGHPARSSRADAGGDPPEVGADRSGLTDRSRGACDQGGERERTRGCARRSLVITIARARSAHASPRSAPSRSRGARLGRARVVRRRGSHRVRA